MALQHVPLSTKQYKVVLANGGDALSCKVTRGPGRKQ